MAIGIKKTLDVKKLFIVLLLSFLALQLLSFVLSEMGYMEMLKGGPMLLLFLVVIFLVTLFSLGRNINQLTLKKDGLFILIIFALIILAFIFLPRYIPSIFSTSGFEIREFLREQIGVVIKLGPGGVTG